MKCCILITFLILIFCLVSLCNDKQDDFLEKFTIAETSDSYEISIKIPNSLQKIGKNTFKIKDGKARVYISFLLSSKPITKVELKELINVTKTLSLIKEEIIEVQGKKIYGYSLVSQNEGLKRMSEYQISALLFLEDTFLVNISITSDRKDESELLSKLYSSIENSKIRKLKDKTDAESVQQPQPFQPQPDAVKSPTDPLN